MPKFLVDEDMPRSTARTLRDKGYDVMDVRDCGLRGKRDQEVFAFAQRNDAVLITGDREFGNIAHFRIGSHAGIVIAHYPNEMSPAEINKQIIEAFAQLTESDTKGNLVILDPGKIRIRRK
jgi:predicted nuclease of predicted toxin-antitoxin system